MASRRFQMNKRKKLSLVLAIIMLIVGVWPSVLATDGSASGFSADDFLKADGPVLRNRSGNGEAINLKGTNIGGWLTLEPWMSPIGRFAIPRTGWYITASDNSPTACNVMDGSSSTFWTPGVSQQNGQWIQIDMGRSQLFNRIELDASENDSCFPSAYQVQVSNDEQNWIDVASGTSTTQNTVIHMTLQNAQYIRITQTGVAASQWRITELNVLLDAVYNKSGWTATASSTASNSSAQNTLDGDLSTQWTSGATQTYGQWYEIDMGKAQSVSRVLIDTGVNSSSNYPRGYQIEVSNDREHWEACSQGDFGTGRIIYQEFIGKTARYLRIKQMGTSENWWSIAEIEVYSPGEYAREDWIASASSTYYDAYPTRALDGVLGSGWNCGLPQTNGQWFKVDLGANYTFNQIVLNSGEGAYSVNEYPRNYRVEVSYDDQNWTEIETNIGGGHQVPINFPVVNARYIRITLTGSNENWWSIDEFNLYLNIDDYSMVDCLESRFGSETTKSLLDGYENVWLTENDLDNIQAMGMNCIRLLIGWREFMNEDGTWKDDPWSRIDWIVNQCSQRKIYVLLDLQTVPGGANPWNTSGRTGPNPNGFWSNPNYQNMVNTIWQGIATRYKGNPAVAGYDLINEPLLSTNETTEELTIKNQLYDRLYNTVRAIDPDHLIVMGVMLGYDKIAAPSEYGWTNVMYQYHPYNMNYPLSQSQQQNTVNEAISAMAYYQQQWNIPMYAGEYFWYGFHDVWTEWMAGLNALNISWTNAMYKVIDTKPIEMDCGFYYNNGNTLPILNSDDTMTLSQKWSKFSTDYFSVNTRLIDTVQKCTEDYLIASTALSNDDWTVTASSTGPGESPNNVLDWNEKTRWSTGTDQSPGQWIQIDMKQQQMFDKISFSTDTNQPLEYPRGYQIQVSNNGVNWTSVAQGRGFGDNMTITIPPQYARYIRLTQTESGLHWWSISEFQVCSEFALNRSSWNVVTSSGNNADSALDCNLSTSWTPDFTQVSEQWYQIDMGKKQSFNRLMMNTDYSSNGGVNSYQVKVSDDQQNWETIVVDQSNIPDVIIEFPVQVARYLRIELFGEETNSWNLSEINVYGEVALRQDQIIATTSASEPGNTPSNALDGDLNSIWRSSTDQGSGQWFKVDLGNSLWISQISLDSGTNTNEYASGFIVEASNDNQSWQHIATDIGTAPLIIVNFPIKPYRYLKITLTENSNHPWTIAEFNVFVNQ